MAKINFLTAYPTATPVASSIVIGSIAANGATNNFLMSDIAAYVMSANTLTLQDVCDNGAVTTTGITVAGTTTLNSTADISGNTTIGGTLGVSQAATFALGVTIDNAGLAINGSGGIIVGSTSGISSFGPISGTALNSTGGLLVSGTSILGEIDSAGPADIADTLTLSKPSGTGLDVTADALINGDANIGGTLITNAIEADTGNLVINDSGGTERVRVTAAGALTVQGDASFTEKFILSAGAPSSASDTGTKDEVAIDANYIYICTATNTWKRVAIETW